MATGVEYALMAGRAYQVTRDPINEFPIPDGWIELAHVPNNVAFPQYTGAEGFEAVSFMRSTGAGTEIVISFAYRKEVPLFSNIGLYIDFAASSKE